MLDAYSAIKSLGAELLAISTDSNADARSAVARLGLQYPVLYDPAADVVKAYGVYNLLGDDLAAPATFIIDKEAKIRWSYVGAHIADRATNRQIVNQLQRLQ